MNYFPNVERMNYSKTTSNPMVDYILNLSKIGLPNLSLIFEIISPKNKFLSIKQFNQAFNWG